MPPSLDRLRRLEALAADAAASPAERATAERLAERERAALGPAAASSSTLPGWSAEELAEYRRRQGEALARWREDQEWRRRRDAEVAEALRRGAALLGQVGGRPAVASERRPQWRPVGQWGPGRRW